MGDVAATIKVMPDSPDVELSELEDTLENALPDGARIRGFEREDVAFGLTAVITSVIVGDAEGGTDQVEEAFAAIDNVESVSVENVGRL